MLAIAVPAWAFMFAAALLNVFFTVLAIRHMRYARKVVDEFEGKLRDPRFTCAAAGIHKWRWEVLPVGGAHAVTSMVRLECEVCHTFLHFDFITEIGKQEVGPGSIEWPMSQRLAIRAISGVVPVDEGEH